MTDELKKRTQELQDLQRDTRYLKECEMARKRRAIDKIAEKLKEAKE